MLQYIRERSQGVIAWAIIILIIIPFALWGVDQFRSGDTKDIAAEVNGEPIPTAELMRAFDSVKRQYQENLGEMYTSLVQEDKLRKEVLDDLVQRRAVEQMIAESGFAIGDAHLNQIIQSQKVFHEKGVFSLSRYEQVLKDNNYTKERFEEAQRNFMAKNQFESMITGEEIVGASELKQLASLESQERDIGYLRVDYRPYLAKATVSDADVKSYYDGHLSQFQAAESLKVDYLSLSMEDLIAQTQVTEAQIKAYYDEHPDKIQLPEKRNVRHILITAAKDAAPEVKSSAEKKAEALLNKIKAGEDFATLAKENSEDPGSASHGGELGFFQRGEMVPEFEKAAFDLKKAGDVSPVIKTDYGYHILQLIAVQEAKTPPLDKVHDVMARELKTELASKVYAEKLDQLKTMTYEQSDSLEPAAKALNLTVKTSDAFTRETGEGAFASPNVVQAAFADSVIKEKLNSSVVEPQMGEAIVMRANVYQPAHEKGFAEVNDEITQTLKRKAAIEQAAKEADSLLAKVKADNADPAMQVRDGVEWVASRWMTRTDTKVLPEVATVAFKAAKPTEGKITWLSHELVTGDTVLIRVAGVRVDEMKAKQIEKDLKQAADQVFADAMLESAKAAVRDAAKVKVMAK